MFDNLLELCRLSVQIPEFIVADDDTAIGGSSSEDETIVVRIHPDAIHVAAWRIKDVIFQFGFEEMRVVDVIVWGMEILTPLWDVNLDGRFVVTTR